MTNQGIWAHKILSERPAKRDKRNLMFATLLLAPPSHPPPTLTRPPGHSDPHVCERRQR